MTIIDLWTRYKSWLRYNVPKSFRGFKKGASTLQLSRVQKKLGINFTDDVREFYQIHNGQVQRRILLFNESELLSFQLMILEWAHWKELHDDGEFNHLKSESDPEVQPVWWDKNWIPFTDNGAGDHLCIDFNPTAKGKYGQIISLYHDQSYREKVADSLYEWFFNYINDLEKGHYVFSKQTCSILKKQ